MVYRSNPKDRRQRAISVPRHCIIARPRCAPTTNEPADRASARHPWPHAQAFDTRGDPRPLTLIQPDRSAQNRAAPARSAAARACVQHDKHRSDWPDIRKGTVRAALTAKKNGPTTNARAHSSHNHSKAPNSPENAERAACHMPRQTSDRD
jgi:hypothetical protein